MEIFNFISAVIIYIMFTVLVYYHYDRMCSINKWIIVLLLISEKIKIYQIEK